MKNRHEVEKEDTWNIEALYPNFAAWEKEAETVMNKDATNGWGKLLEKQGSLGKDAKGLKDFLEALFAIERLIDRTYTYAHLAHDQEITHEEHKTAYNKMQAAYFHFAQDLSWVEPELLSLGKEAFSALLQAEDLVDYHFYLEKLWKQKPHVLSEGEEKILALSQNALQTPSKAFSSLNNADFKFGEVADSKGEKHELSHASYSTFLRSQDRELRKNAFTRLHKKFARYENTLCELLSGVVQKHWFTAKARNYGSCLEAALSPKNISTEVYRSLIKAVRSRIGSLHQYNALRKEMMGLDELHLYDMYVTLVPSVERKYSFKEGCDLVLESVELLGEDYHSILKKGLGEERWVDRYENENKRSGAYSSGCFDSMPYILMNFQGFLNDVLTLSHEAGHSMHSLHSHRAQPYHYSQYSIFVAEVASTFHEELLMQLLLKRAQSPEEKMFLLNQKLEDIRGTLFRQTMFAEFELTIHELVEKSIPLTPQLLKDKYLEIVTDYMGPSVAVDQDISLEWSRIPHFYYNFYVYQYSTGISAALSLAKRVLEGGQEEKDQYLRFLSMGGSKYPLDQLRLAGVEMTKPDAVFAAVDRFDALQNELRGLYQSSSTLQGV